MSIFAVGWAMKRTVSRSSEKFVLVCLANYSDEAGIAYPSVAALASDTGQDRKTVIRGLQALAEAGWIMDTGNRIGATKQIPVYCIQFENDPQNGTVPKTEQSPISAQTVPFFPSKSTVFPHKESQKRDTEPSGTIKEPSGNQREPSLPDWLPLDAWNGYLEMRKANRWKPTAYATTLLMRDLEKWRRQGHDIASILDKSTASNYRGLFPPDDRPRAAPKGPTANQQMQQNVIGAMTSRQPRAIDVDATEVFAPALTRRPPVSADHSDIRDTEDSLDVVGVGSGTGWMDG